MLPRPPDLIASGQVHVPPGRCRYEQRGAGRGDEQPSVLVAARRNCSNRSFCSGRDVARNVAGAAVLVGAGLAGVRRGQPLPLRPAGSVRVSDAADLIENDEGGAVSV